MKFIVSISLHLLLLFVFTTAPNSRAWACGGKDNCKKETTEHKAKCKKDCCKKPYSESKKNKKGCCGDNCGCAVSLTVTADVPTQLSFNNAPIDCPLVQAKRAFFYKQSVIQSTIQDIWQPPITVLSV
jgi:hypothetical protein